MPLSACAGVLFLIILGGCASSNSGDTALNEAWQGKEAAYLRLAKAITTYCAVSTQTLDARQSCIIERRLAAEQPENIPLSGRSLSQLRSSR